MGMIIFMLGGRRCLRISMDTLIFQNGTVRRRSLFRCRKNFTNGIERLTDMSWKMKMKWNCDSRNINKMLRVRNFLDVEEWLCCMEEEDELWEDYQYSTEKEIISKTNRGETSGGEWKFTNFQNDLDRNDGRQAGILKWIKRCGVLGFGQILAH